MKQLVVLRQATIASLLLSIALGVVTIRNLTNTRRQTERIDNAITNYALAIRSLQVDLLNERAGLVRNYDQVNGDLALAQNSLAILQHSSLNGRARSILDELAAKDREQEDLVQQFNGDNALLQTALLYVTDYNGNVAGSQLLFNRILKLTLDTSPKTVREAQAALDQTHPPRKGSPSARPLSYARLLVETLPEIDSILSSVRAIRLESTINALQTAAREETLARTSKVQKLELSLAAAIILLMMTSATFLMVQRLHTRELQARAANERLSAAIAIPLIDTGPGTFRSRIQEAADRLALHIGARRLQLAAPSLANCLQYSRHGELAPDWLTKLADAAESDDAWNEDRVITSREECPVGNALGRAMRELGVRTLVLLRTAEPFRVMIGFEPENYATAQRSDRLAGLLSALIAIAHSTRREVMQLERERLEQSLAERRRMANLGAIASGVAHNFNNIIGAISGFAQIGQARTEEGSTIYQSFDEIQGSVERARELIDAILSYAKQRLSNRTPLNLGDLLCETTRMLSASSKGETEFDLTIPAEQYIVYGAKSALQQVFLNICKNAADVSKGKSVQIRTQRSELAEKCQMSHDSLYPGKYVVVTITDAGSGIPQGLRARLFEPFFTTKSGGTGLGLSTAWEIVQQTGGTIDVAKVENGGSRFSVWLPEIAANANGDIVGNGARILLVADPERLSSEEDMLAELGYEPVGFPVSAKVEKISEMIASVDAVLIAAWGSWQVNEILHEIAPLLHGRPLLLAASDNNNWQHSAPSASLLYPVRVDQVSALLSQAISDRMAKDRTLPGDDRLPAPR